MPSYLSLVSWTDQGVKDARGAPARVEAVKQAAKDAGGRMIFFYMLMGQWDIATLLELPDDESAAKLLLKLGAAGNVRTTTMRAFTEDEFRAIVSDL